MKLQYGKICSKSNSTYCQILKNGKVIGWEKRTYTVTYPYLRVEYLTNSRPSCTLETLEELVQFSL